MLCADGVISVIRTVPPAALATGSSAAKIPKRPSKAKPFRFIVMSVLTLGAYVIRKVGKKCAS